MALVLSALSLLAVVLTVSGQWVCPDGYTGKTPPPSCLGATSPSCSDFSCCDATAKFCSEYAAVWALSQALGGGCAADTKFFDLKKGTTVVGGSQSEADIKAACCTASADATCADWTLKTCTGTNPYRIVAASAPGDDSLSISATDFQDKCCAEKSTCESHTCSAGTKKSTPASRKCSGDAASCTDETCCDPPKTCATYAVAWALSQVAGGGCADVDMFFDLKKSTKEVGGSQAETDIKAACCTGYSEATCADWSTVKSCGTGKYVDFTVAAPADGPDTGTKTTLTNDKFKELCCKPPLACSAYVAPAEETVGAACPYSWPLGAGLASLMLTLTC